MGNEVEGGRRCRRKDCAAARDALAQAEMRIAQLDAEVVALHAELSEALKGLELANAEVKRFKQAMADVEPHRPERTPPQQLLFGWETVLASLSADTPDGEPANDNAELVAALGRIGRTKAPLVRRARSPRGNR